MRIKIEGEITAERLAEAFQQAIEKIVVAQGTVFYGANLYLSAYNAEGISVNLVDQRREPMMVTIAAPPGTLVRPAITAEGAERRRVAKEAAAAARAQAQAEADRKQAKYEEEARQRRAMYAASEAIWETLNASTAQLMDTRADEFIDEINRIVRNVWDEMRPVEPNGKNKGEPRPMPRFLSIDGALVLDLYTWSAPRQVRNPIYRAERWGQLQPFWAHEAWAEVGSRITLLLDAWTAPVESQTNLEVDQ